MKQYKNPNPITKLDYPDPDVIRVGDIYYMVTTTMHFFPGCEILRSYDLVHWEHATYVYDFLENQTLNGEKNAYGKGMWAASIRYHDDTFYISFAANDTNKTYLYKSKDILGKWEKSNIEGFYHDNSLLFDDGKVYIVYGNRHIHITELKSDLSGPKTNGLNRILVSDDDNAMLGYEGSHIYKINGKYYLFLIHSPKDRWFRTQACFVANSLDDEFVGGDIFCDDMGYCNQGIAQGGIVDTPNGDWYAVLFQDRGAVGRLPMLIPISFKNDFFVFGTNGETPDVIQISSNKPDYKYQPLVQSDDFAMPITKLDKLLKEQYGCFGLKSVWQFNHEPNMNFVHWNADNKTFGIESQKICKNLTQAQNTLTQRMIYPSCAGEITVDGSLLNDGDFAGICALQSCYGMVAITKRDDNFYIVMINREPENNSLQAMPNDDTNGREQEAVAVKSPILRLKVEVDFTNMKDEANFYYQDENEWKKVGVTHKLYFKTDHFVGCRMGLFNYSTQKIGGKASFSDFKYFY